MPVYRTYTIIICKMIADFLYDIFILKNLGGRLCPFHSHTLFVRVCRQYQGKTILL